MRQTANDAVAAARRDESCSKGMCLAYVVKWLDAPKIGCPDAITSWNWATQKRTDRNPPAGAPVYWKGGKHGHIALGVGNGKVRSTDCHSAYDVSEVGISWPEDAWGYKYLGWAADISKTPIPYLQAKPPEPKPPPPKPKDYDMFFGTSPDGSTWCCNGIVKTRIEVPATSHMLAKFAFNVGNQSSEVWAEFPTYESQYKQVNDKLNTIINS